jgi:phospholipid-binding lipoprotein MlaA
MIGASAMKILRKKQHLSVTVTTATAALAVLVAGGASAIGSSAHAQTAAEAPVPLVAAPDAATDMAQTAYDPLEGVNRGSYAFSMGLDRAVFRPVAHGYMAVAPRSVRHRVSSVVYNLGEPSTVLNDVSAGQAQARGQDVGAFRDQLDGRRSGSL